MFAGLLDSFVRKDWITVWEALATKYGDLSPTKYKNKLSTVTVLWRQGSDVASMDSNTDMIFVMESVPASQQIVLSAAGAHTDFISACSGLPSLLHVRFRGKVDDGMGSKGVKGGAQL